MKWYSISSNRSIEIADMSTSHIINTINCLKGLGKSIIPNPFHGVYHSEWLYLFEEELYKRDNKKVIYELW